MFALLDVLRALEVELHHPGVCCSRDRLERLLHPAFHEIGRSGRPYSRETVISYLQDRATFDVVESTDFRLAMLAENCALLTYRSSHRQADGSTTLPTRRSSIWLCCDSCWQLRYHQGTPAPDDVDRHQTPGGGDRKSDRNPDRNPDCTDDGPA